MLKTIFYIIISVPTFLCLSNDLYGPFDVRLSGFTLCHAPKSKDCAIMEARISGRTSISFNMTVFKTCSPSKGKIIPSANGKELARLHMNKPCEHVFLRPIFENFYNATKKCQILKGEYVRVIDLGHYVTNYFGGSFFYGNVSFRTYLYNDECNFSCSFLELELTPKK